MSEENKEIMIKETNEVVKIDRTLLPVGTESINLMDWLKILAEAPYYKKIGLPGMVAIVLTGRECGVGTMASLNGGFWDILGKISMSAEQMRAQFRLAGHSLTIVSLDEKFCTLRGKRKDTHDMAEYTFTMDDAAKAGNANKDNWKKDPKSMLMASCTRKLIRFLAPELIAGTGIEEGEILEAEVEVIEPKPMDKETAMFIERFGLLDLHCDASRFVDAISANTEESRLTTITNAAKEPDRFEKNLERFIEKTKPKVEKVKS